MRYGSARNEEKETGNPDGGAEACRESGMWLQTGQKPCSGEEFVRAQSKMGENLPAQPDPCQ